MSDDNGANASNPLVQVHAAGQSLWLDFIQKSLLDGELQRLIREDRIMGLTSNPSIFEQAIAKTDEYDAHLARLLEERPEASDLELFEHLAIEDIRAAADVFRDTWEQTDGLDGMVSLEVVPELAHDAKGTVEMAVELAGRVDRPNLMIKVPGTEAGIEAFEEIISRGINVNVTLLFGVPRYKEIAQAYIRGLERRRADGHSVERLASVASFFVSRVDAAVDDALEANGSDEALALRGKVAVANAKVAYGHYLNLFGSSQFEALAKDGARPQRLLWASTGTKNPDYSDVLYVEELIGRDTVNTLPPKTLEAFRDHGTVEARLGRGLDEAQATLDALDALGIDLAEITATLETDGIGSFADAFDRLMEALAEERRKVAS